MPGPVSWHQAHGVWAWMVARWALSTPEPPLPPSPSQLGRLHTSCPEPGGAELGWGCAGCGSDGHIGWGEHWWQICARGFGGPDTELLRDKGRSQPITALSWGAEQMRGVAWNCLFSPKLMEPRHVTSTIPCMYYLPSLQQPWEVVPLIITIILISQIRG